MCSRIEGRDNSKIDKLHQSRQKNEEIHRSSVTADRSMQKVEIKAADEQKQVGFSAELLEW